MATKSMSLVRGRRIRLTRLDACGRPVYGEDSTLVSKGFVSVSISANTAEGEEVNVTNAAGERCVYEPAETSINSYGVEIEFCEVDPDLFALVTGQNVVTDPDGDVIGFDVDTAVSLENQGFALELWAGTASGDACSTEGAQGSFGYLLLPFVKGGIVGDFTVENGAISMNITGGTTRDGNAWGVGPYSDVQLVGGVAGPMSTPVTPTTAFRLQQTELAPPAAATGARPLLDPSIPALTGITATAADGDSTGMTVEFDTTPASEGPVWYEFGDGEWDYVAAPGTGSHAYTESGTYTVRASQNSVDWVETTVTLPL